MSQVADNSEVYISAGHLVLTQLRKLVVAIRARRSMCYRGPFLGRHLPSRSAVTKAFTQTYLQQLGATLVQQCDRMKASSGSRLSGMWGTSLPVLAKCKDQCRAQNDGQQSAHIRSWLGSMMLVLLGCCTCSRQPDSKAVM